MKLQMDYSVEGRDIVLKNPSCFSLLQTFDCGQAFRFSQHGDVWSGVVGDKNISLVQTDSEIRFLDLSESDFLNTFVPYFTLDIDYPSLIKDFSDDEILKKASEIGCGIRMLRQEPFETLCTFILSQNCNIPRIRGMVYRLCEAFGDEIEKGVYTFPTAQKLSKLTPDDLSPVRAGFRAKYLIDAAKCIADKTVDFSLMEKMSTEEASLHLQQIKGVGEKVAACTLLFGFGRWDSFPIDVWMKRVLSKYYPDGFPEKHKKYAGIAQQYLFFYERYSGNR